MFNIGFGELAIICIVLIIAVGPERLPSMMKTLGKTIRTLRQASRDIRASTGIDELMREDFDLYAPVKNAQPRRPAAMPAPIEPAALPAPATPPAADTSASTAASVATLASAEPKPVSREDIVEEATPGDRPSVVVAPPPQTVGLPSDEPTPAMSAQPPTAAAEPVEPTQPTAASSNGAEPAAAITSNVDTLPRAPIVQPASSNATPQPAAQPKAAEPADEGEDGSAAHEPKQSGA
jgi:sec-independent protein translocase protein TatB